MKNEPTSARYAFCLVNRAGWKSIRLRLENFLPQVVGGNWFFSSGRLWSTHRRADEVAWQVPDDSRCFFRSRRRPRGNPVRGDQHYFWHLSQLPVAAAKKWRAVLYFFRRDNAAAREPRLQPSAEGYFADGKVYLRSRRPAAGTGRTQFFFA